MFRGCPLCKNKTESVVNTYLKNNKFNFLKEFVIPGSLRRYDFLLKDFNLIIEVDGEQHFKTVKHFRLSAADNQKNDMEKWLYARDHGYSILRISQLDIYKNKIDWKNIILENMIIRHQPDIIYASFDEKLYDEFKSQFPNSSC
jgi:very-short-patch-repair endonuclease